MLSALAGLHINNCEIIIDNVEVPILDGSSKIYVNNNLNVGLKDQNSEQSVLEIVKPVKFRCDYGFAELNPTTESDSLFNLVFDTLLTLSD